MTEDEDKALREEVNALALTILSQNKIDLPFTKEYLVETCHAPMASFLMALRIGGTPQRMVYYTLLHYATPKNATALGGIPQRMVYYTLLPYATSENATAPCKVVEAEKAALQNALNAAGGNISEAAVLAGVGRTTMYRKINDLGLTVPKKRDNA